MVLRVKKNVFQCEPKQMVASIVTTTEIRVQSLMLYVCTIECKILFDGVIVILKTLWGFSLSKMKRGFKQTNYNLQYQLAATLGQMATWVKSRDPDPSNRKKCGLTSCKKTCA